LYPPHLQVQKYEEDEEDEGKKGGGNYQLPLPPIKGKRDCHG
jgi:hypothetical protein